MPAQLHHVSIFVSDLERSLELFTGLLGMQKVQRLNGVRGRRLANLIGIADFEADMVFLKHPQQHISLELVRQTGGQKLQLSSGASGFGLSFLVTNLEEIHRRLAEAGWTPLSDPLDMMDPDGRPVRLFCFLTEEGLMVELIGRP